MPMIDPEDYPVTSRGYRHPPDDVGGVNVANNVPADVTRLAEDINDDVDTVAAVASGAAADLASHEAATTDVHGIADTSLLVTSAAVGNLLTENQSALTSGTTSGTGATGDVDIIAGSGWGSDYALRWTATATSAQVVTTTPYTALPAASDDFTAFAHLSRGTGARAAQMSVYWYTAGGVFISASSSANTSIDGGGTTIALPVTRPATATQASLVITFAAGSIGDTMTVHARGLWRGILGAFALPGQVVTGQAPDSYPDGSIPRAAIADGAIDGSKLAEGAVTPVSVLPVTSTIAGAVEVSRTARHLSDALAGLTVSGTTSRTGNSLVWAWDGVTNSANLAGSPQGAFTWSNLRQVSDSALLHANTDDIAPIALGWTFIGANHGYLTARWTVAGHGKATADLGSQWSTGGITLTLADIDGDVLDFLYPVIATGSGTFGANPATLASGTITHASGATNTAAITTTASSTLGQLYPSIGNVDVTCDLEDGYSGPLTEIVVRESYTIADYADLVATAQATIGSPVADWIDGVDAAFDVEVEYRHLGPQTWMRWTATAGTAQDVAYAGGMQAAPLSIPAGGTLKMWVPGLAAKSGTTYGALAGQDITAAPASVTFAASDLLTPGVPPVESVQVAYDASGVPTLGLRVLYGDLDQGADANRLTAAAGGLWWVHSTRKSYPAFHRGVMTAGQRISATMSRTYLTPTGGRIDTGVRAPADIDGGTA